MLAKALVQLRPTRSLPSVHNSVSSAMLSPRDTVDYFFTTVYSWQSEGIKPTQDLDALESSILTLSLNKDSDNGTDKTSKGKTLKKVFTTCSRSYLATNQMQKSTL